MANGTFESYDECVLKSASMLCGYMKEHDMSRSSIEVKLPDGKIFHYIGWIEEPDEIIKAKPKWKEYTGE